MLTLRWTPGRPGEGSMWHVCQNCGCIKTVYFPKPDQKYGRSVYTWPSGKSTPGAEQCGAYPAPPPDAPSKPPD